MLKHMQTLGYCGTAHRRRYGRDEVKSGTSRALAGARRARAAAEHRMQYGGQLSPDASCEERSVTSCRRVFACPFVTSGVGAPTQALLALPTPVHRRGAQTQGQRASSRLGGSGLPGSAHCAFTRGSCTTDQETVPRLLGASPGAGAYHGAPPGCCIRPVQGKTAVAACHAVSAAPDAGRGLKSGARLRAWEIEERALKRIRTHIRRQAWMAGA